MKRLITILLFIARFYIGFKIALWIFLKSSNPQSHQLSEIEVFLVFALFDSWMISISTNFNNEIKDLEN